MLQNSSGQFSRPVCIALELCAAGLRLGGAGGGNADASSPLIAHMDHLLLLGRKEDLGYEGLGWRALAPDCVLQLGGHLTSKRLGQFLDWAALGSADR